MAFARLSLLRSRLVSHLAPNSPPAHSLVRQGFASFFDVTKGSRAIHESDDKIGEDSGDSNLQEDSRSNPNIVKPQGAAEESSVTYAAFSKLKTSTRHDMAMIFTCKVCETRSVKTLCRESYEKGVVVARCGGCNNLHLIADHLGWFGQPGTVEDLLAARGEEVRRGSVDTLNLTLEDLAGTRSS